MGIGSMSGRLVPMITGGGGGSGGRPGDWPVLATPRPANAVSWFEDFFSASIATISYTDSGTDTIAYGHPSWIAKSIQGTGSIGCGSGTTSTGVVGLATGTTSGDGLLLDAAGRGTTIASGITHSNTLAWTFCTRFSINTLATSKVGIGLVAASGISTGTDWVSDPLTTLGGVDSVVITYDPAVDSGAIMGRVDGTSAGAVGEIILVASPAGGTFYKIECAWNPNTDLLSWYVNGVLIGTLDAQVLGALALRTSMGIVSTSAAAKLMQCDFWLQEVGQASAR